MHFVDSHCHLDRLDLSLHDGSLDAALDAARARGVSQFLCIGVDAGNAPTVQALAERYADVHCAVGIHPLDAAQGSAIDLDWLLERPAQPRCAPIGGTGLALHYTLDIGAVLQSLQT